ncbi:c6 zinc finger domain containing protein [Grosmannia clavigera kw1407]|uniref:C6 zinc finger domain containing protein n=1 Tax=Grosmannia clavigera (strain kw1407 / UAMH 11150) TaxID=655863 RepID=F0X6K0_GROCL|nr:c6 zinc finger domain containing protein [Grosmannia clavigera kw1407]EFX06275.1 c6 zinc finger domain containing protein [Grosmannia clavigera kw1407]
MAPSADDAGRTASSSDDTTPRPTAAPAMGHQACERCWKRKQKAMRPPTAVLLDVCRSGRDLSGEERTVRLADRRQSAVARLDPETLKRRLDELAHAPPHGQNKRARLDGDRPRSDGVAVAVSSFSSPPSPSAPAPPLIRTAVTTTPSTVRIRTAASEAGTSSTRLRAHASTSTAATSLAADDEVAADATDGSIRAMMGEIGFLSRSAIGEPHDDEPTTAVQRPLRLAPDRVVMAALALDGHDPSGSGRDGGSAAAAAAATGDSKNGSAPLHLHPHLTDPPDDWTWTLTRLASAVHLRRFLDEVAVRFPHLATAKAADQLEAQYEAVLKAQHDAVLQSQSSSSFFSSSSAPSPSARLAVYLAVATGALLAPNAARLHGFAQRLHAAAVRLLPAVLVQRPGASAAGNSNAGEALAAIRAIVALVIYATLSPDGGSAWHLLGMATKRCIVLGLRREPDVQSAVEADERRRLFWSVYLLDRSIGLVMDRPFSIQDEDISVSMPEDDSSSREIPPFFSLSHHLVVQARLVSAVRTAARTAPLFDYSNFCYWRDFPPPLDHLPADARETHADFLHLLACRTLVQITANCLHGHEPAASSTTVTATITTTTETKAITVDASDSSPSVLSSSSSVAASSASTSTPHSPKEEDPGTAQTMAPVEAEAATTTAPPPLAPSVSVGLLSGQSLRQSIDDDAARHCRGLIERAYARADRELVLSAPLSTPTTFLPPVSFTSCTMLITSIGERFSALKPLRRVLVALLARLRARKMAHGSIPELDTLPAIVPTYLKRMIHNCL